MGSRYGGLKQLDSVGPSGETIIDYSIYDAIKAGFGKLVYLIRKDIEEAFKEKFDSKYRGLIEIDYAFQGYELPEGFPDSVERAKPWGTAHAVLSARDSIDGPFAVINADDFYGAGAYQSVANFFASHPIEMNGKTQFALVGYRLQNTLSDFGSVSRGIGVEDDDGNLVAINERHGVERKDDGIYYQTEDGNMTKVESSSVSMNFFGFSPAIFPELEKKFKTFVAENGQNPKSEFLIPEVVDQMINDGQADVKVLKTDAKWYGVTYKEDKPKVTEAMSSLVSAGDYPTPLW